jgi:hypothetical protein
MGTFFTFEFDFMLDPDLNPVPDMHSGDFAKSKISCGFGSATLVSRNSVSELDLGFLLNAHPDPGFFMTADLDPGLSEPKLTLRI